MEKNSNPAATPPSAQDDEVEKFFNQLDIDGNGRISPVELGAVFNGSKLDCNGDGYIDLNEFKSFNYLCADGDDRELKEAFGLYKDKNGKISAAELNLAALRRTTQ